MSTSWQIEIGHGGSGVSRNAPELAPDQVFRESQTVTLASSMKMSVKPRKHTMKSMRKFLTFIMNSRFEAYGLEVVGSGLF
jgi:hypothetical protein